MPENNPDNTSKIATLEMAEVLSCSLGSLSLGSAAVAGFTDFISRRPEQYVATGTLSAIAVLSLVCATVAGNKIITMQRDACD